MSAAAAKRTVLAAVSLLAFATLAILVPAGSASDGDSQSPTTPQNLRVTSATASLVTVVWDPSTDDVGVAGYEVRRSDQPPVTVDKPEYAVTGLQCGQSTRLRVVAFDHAQNRSGKATLTVGTTACLDTHPPAAPHGFTQIATTANAVVLGWSPSSDNVGVVEYAVYRNLQRVVTTAEPNATLGGLACGSTYSYLVDAADAAGNRSLQANVYVRTADCNIVTDTTPPTTPTGLAPTSIAPTALALSWNAATDNVGVTGYDVYNNGAKVASPTTTSMSQSGLSCGTSYLLKVSAHDAAGNSSPRARRSVSTSPCTSSTDTTPPSLPTGLAASGITQTGFALSWTASSDDTGVAGYDVYRDGNKVASPTATSVTQYGLACGKSYAIEVSARDAAGNTSPRALMTVSTGACATPQADTTPPSTPPGLGVSGATSTSVLLGWNASIDNSGVAGYRVYVNGAYTTTTTLLNATISGLSCGTAYTFGVDAVDALGNISVRASVTGSTTACPDTAAPTAPTNVVTTSRTATSVALNWSASSDNVGVTGYGLYRGGSSAGTSSTTTGIFSGLLCGTNYTLAVDAGDAAGNRSPQTVVMVSTTACPDTTPPSAPTGLSASSVTQIESHTDLDWVDRQRRCQRLRRLPRWDEDGDGHRDVVGAERSGVRNVVHVRGRGPRRRWKQLHAGAAAGVDGDMLRTAPASQRVPRFPPTASSRREVAYTGSYTGTVTIATTSPVTLSNARVTNTTGGVLVDANGAGASQITLDHVVLTGGNSYQTSGRAFRAAGYKSITIRNCTIENTRGIQLDEGAASSTVVITRNRHHNIQGGNFNQGQAVGNFVQFRDIQNAAIEVSWNEVVNEYNRSAPTDIVSIFKTANVKMHDNYIDHQSEPGNTAVYSQNTVTVDPGGQPEMNHDNEIWNNQLVDALAIGIFGGSNNRVHDNRVVQDGYLPDGVTRMGQWSEPFFCASGGANNVFSSNTAAFVNKDGSYQYGNLSACSASNNSYLPIAQATEQGERASWQAKLAANGIQVGA